MSTHSYRIFGNEGGSTSVEQRSEANLSLSSFEELTASLVQRVRSLKQVFSYTIRYFLVSLFGLWLSKRPQVGGDGNGLRRYACVVCRCPFNRRRLLNFSHVWLLIQINCTRIPSMVGSYLCVSFLSPFQDSHRKSLVLKCRPRSRRIIMGQRAKNVGMMDP